MSHVDVLGRERELEALDRFVAAASEGPASLHIEGDSGIGKTTLWAAAVTSARARNFTVLSCRPAGNEVQLSFAALGDLIGDAFEATRTDLPAPQRRALEVALLVEESHGPPPEQRAIGLAVLAVLRLLAGQHPVLVAIDDAQWVDAPTTAVLGFALRRLSEEPVGFLAATRTEAGQDGIADLIRALPAGRQSRLRVEPLSVAAVHQLIRARLAVGLPRGLLLRVHEAAGGNPFYALELARALQQNGGRLELGEELPLPPSLAALLDSRIAALPDTAQSFLLAMALTSRPTIEAARAALGARRIRVALEAALAAGVLESDGERLVFTHPLLATAVVARSRPEDRRRMHRSLAAVTEDAEEQARHLALGSPARDADVAATLDRAAQRALARGAPGAAAELFELAIERTPLEQEPDIRRRKLWEVDALTSSGANRHATSILQALKDQLPPGAERADVLLRLARVADGLDESVAFADEAMREPIDDDRLLSAIHLQVAMAWLRRGMPYALRHGRLGLAHARRSGERRLVVRALALLSRWELWAGLNPSALLARAVAMEEPTDGLVGYETPRLALALWHMYRGELDEARALDEVLSTEAAESGDVFADIAARARLVDVAWRAGQWQHADAQARALLDAADQAGLEYDGGFSPYWKALIDAHMGRVAEARSTAERGTSLARGANATNTMVMNQGVLGFIELSLGNESAAYPYLQPAIEWLTSRRLGLVTHPTVPYCLEALIGVGRFAEARVLIARFERQAVTLQSRWALGIAARIRAMLMAAEGDLRGALAAATEALGYDPDGRWPFERARTLHVLGRLQRRAKQKAAAKRSLGQAMRIFEALPAPLWTERARQELQRVGLRPAAPDALTETERRVAELAASGLKNREVAAQLFVSPKTVEANLARVYRKLDLHSRAELGARLARDGDASAQM